MARTRPYHGFIAQSFVACRKGWPWFSPTSHQQETELKVVARGMQVRLQRDPELFRDPTLKYRRHPHGYSPGSRVACLEAGPATSLPGVGVSDSVTLFKEWDRIQGGELGWVYNNASCLH